MIMIFRSQAWFRNAVSAAIVCAGICGCALPQLAQQKGRPKPSQEKFSCGESIPKSKLSPAEFEAATRTSTPLPAAGGGAAYQNVQTDWTPRAADGSSQPH